LPSIDEERLVVSIEARITDIERNMRKANRTTTESFQGMRRSSRSATQQMEQDMVRSTTRINQALAQTSTRIGAFGKAFIGGLAVGAAVGALEGIRQAAHDSTKAILEMSDQAKVAGVSFKAFQQLKFVAEQNRVGVDALTDGLKELSLRADEFIQTGGGSAAESFQRLGYNAEDLAKKLKEPDQLFLEIIGRLKSLDKAAQIRISDELFGGTGGEKFVQLIDRGEQGIRDQIKAAQDLGIVMDESMVKKAEEVNQKFNAIATTISTHVKSAIVDAVDAWSTFIDSYNEFRDQQKSTLEFRQAQIGLRKTELENSILQEKERNSSGGLFSASSESRIKKYREELDALIAEDARITNEISKRYASNPPSTFVPPTPPPGGFTSTSSSGGKADLSRFLASGKDASHISGMSNSFESKLEKMFEALPKELAGQLKINSGFRSTERQAQLWQEALAKYGSVTEARKWVAPPGNSQHNKGNAADLGYGSDAARRWAHENAGKFGLSFPLSNENWHIEDSDARGKAMADKTQDLEQRGQAYDDMIAKAKEYLASEQLETDALGMTREAASRLRHEQDLLNEAKQAGITLNPTQIEGIKQLAAEMAAAEERTRKLAKSQEDAQRAAEEFGAQAKVVAGGFVSDLMRGVDASDALRSALARIGDMALDGLLNQVFGGGDVKGGGLFGQMFSGLFKLPGNANGTNDWRGGPTWVGERGPEIVNLPKHAQVIPNHVATKPTVRAAETKNFRGGDVIIQGDVSEKNLHLIQKAIEANNKKLGYMQDNGWRR
jgi:septum formation inhibitor MinC